MNKDTFQHYLQELIASAQNSDFIKLMVQLDYFGDLSLSQQLEASIIAKEQIKPETFVQIYKAVVSKNVRQVRLNPVLRKITKDKFLTEPTALEQVIREVDISNPMTIDFVSECVNESNIAGFETLWKQRINGDTVVAELPSSTVTGSHTEPLSRESLMIRIKELGQQQTPQAVKELVTLSGTDVGFDVIIINQLMNSKLDEGIAGTVQFLGSESTRIRHYAIAKLEEVKEKATAPLLDQLKQSFQTNKNDESIAILGVLKTVGDRSNSRIMRHLIHSAPDDVNVKVAFYETLTEIDPVGTAPFLIEQVCDGVDDLAYSAATLLDKQSTPAIVEGVLNILESEMITVERLVEIFVFSSCKNILSELRKDSGINSELIRLCSLPGMEQYAKQHGLSLTDENRLPLVDPIIWAVDDSRMILRMYEHFAVDFGAKVKTFDHGSELLNALQTEEHPSLIFVDLNMPGISGVDVSKGIAEMGFDSIPRILVTTQSDAELDRNVQNALFKEIVQKPFDNTILAETANRYLVKDF